MNQRWQRILGNFDKNVLWFCLWNFMHMIVGKLLSNNEYTQNTNCEWKRKNLFTCSQCNRSRSNQLIPNEFAAIIMCAVAIYLVRQNTDIKLTACQSIWHEAHPQLKFLIKSALTVVVDWIQLWLPFDYQWNNLFSWFLIYTSISHSPTTFFHPQKTKSQFLHTQFLVKTNINQINFCTWTINHTKCVK